MRIEGTRGRVEAPRRRGPQTDAPVDAFAALLGGLVPTEAPKPSGALPEGGLEGAALGGSRGAEAPMPQVQPEGRAPEATPDAPEEAAPEDPTPAFRLVQDERPAVEAPERPQAPRIEAKRPVVHADRRPEPVEVDAEPAVAAEARAETVQPVRERPRSRAEDRSVELADDPGRPERDDPTAAHLETEVAVEAAPEAEWVELPVDAQERLDAAEWRDGLRVEVDADLAIHVAMDDDRVEVTVDGTREALQDLQGFAQELSADLQQGGERSLARYTVWERSSGTSPRRAGAVTTSAAAPTVSVRRGHLVDRTA